VPPILRVSELSAVRIGERDITWLSDADKDQVLARTGVPLVP
jgi:hypothetical protein